MLKRFIPLAVSVAALVALAAPTAQAANPLIVDSVSGAAVTNITAVSTNTNWMTPAGTIECTTTDLKGHITINTNNTAQGHGTGNANGTRATKTHIGHCGTSSGFAVDTESITISSLHLEKAATGTAGTVNFSSTYKLTLPPPFGTHHCTLHSAGATVKRTGTDTINVNGSLIGTGGGFCPASGTITGDFTVTNAASGAPVTIN